MLIIKPYGRSTVTAEVDTGRRRRITLRETAETVDIVPFATDHDELVIAQWISTIDKIASKPRPGRAATDAQKSFRSKIGNAAWAHLSRHGLLPGLENPAKAARLALIWQTKIAPYGDAPYQPRRRQGKVEPEPSPKGRHYETLAGNTEPAKIDPAAVVSAIHRHLHVAERKKDGSEKQRGRIASRAESIAGNVLKPAVAKADWSADDSRAYVASGDVAVAIRAAARRRERGEDNGGTRGVGNSVAGEVLYAHWAKLFAAADGAVLGFAEATKAKPGVVALHVAVKDYYVRRLKRHSKKPPKTVRGRDGQVSFEDSSLVRTLPGNWDELLRQIGFGQRNRSLAALVRLGKIIHYEAAQGRDDSTAHVTTNWPADVSASRYWGSDGQADIKRNEAFVRVWRHVLSLGAATLRDWAAPAGYGDILLAGPLNDAIGSGFDVTRYSAKVALLFGNRAAVLTGQDGFQRAVLKAALRAVAQLRHKSFHFAGRGGFLDALEGLATVDAVAVPEVLNAICGIVETDDAGRASRIGATMAGAGMLEHYDQGQNNRLFDAVVQAKTGRLPLPRFVRLLLRADNAWSSEARLLPPPVSRVDLEVPARLASYTAIKLLYEKPFRGWLEALDRTRVNGFIAKAYRRGTAAAQTLNGRKDDPGRELIRTRAEALGALGEDETLPDFFDRLTAATATEMRVQNAYESDGEQAREQAGFIEEFRCDLVALAFREFLDENAFAFALDPSPPARDTVAPLPEATARQSGTGYADWQAVLYFVMHLVPVDEAGRLLHQLRKWAILVGKGGGTERPVDAVLSVVELYLDMHDAKFEGGAGVVGADHFRPLYENDAAFDAMFPRQIESEDRRVPRRGLREIMRFGHLAPLRSIFGAEAIRQSEVTAWLAAETAGTNGASAVAALQAKREALHAEWTTDTKRGLSTEAKRAYVETVAAISKHRRLAGRVTLTDHVRLHRLLMAVMGRLVDFSGLWERDLYFATLGALHDAGQTPAATFDRKGLALLGNGQVIFALDTVQHAWLRNQLEPHFGKIWEKGNASRRIRNDLSHFNMLQGTVDLTRAVNDTRALLRHDRKMTNAVSGAVIELLAREGLDLTWRMEAGRTPHLLTNAGLVSRQATHLGKTRLFEKGEPERRNAGRPIVEDLHGHGFVAMAARLFQGAARASRFDVASLDFSRIDWNRIRGEREKPRPGGSKNHRRAKR